MKKITLIFLIIFVVVVLFLFVEAFFENNGGSYSQNTNQPATTSVPAVLKSFTLNEAAKHSTESDCYLVINNKVYDASSYIGKHPGGRDTIISNCGKEVTGIFAQIHSNRAWDLLAKYQIGIIK